MSPCTHRPDEDAHTASRAWLMRFGRRPAGERPRAWARRPRVQSLRTGWRRQRAGGRSLAFPVGPARRRLRPARGERSEPDSPDPTPTGLRSSPIAGRPAWSRCEEWARPVPGRRRPPDGSVRAIEPSRRAGDETTGIAQSTSRYSDVPLSRSSPGALRWLTAIAPPKWLAASR